MANASDSHRSLPQLFVMHDQKDMLHNDPELRSALLETVHQFDPRSCVHDRRLKTNSLVPRCKDIHQVRVTHDKIVFMKYDEKNHKLFLLKFRGDTVIDHKPKTGSDYSRALTSFEHLPPSALNTDPYQLFDF